MLDPSYYKEQHRYCSSPSGVGRQTITNNHMNKDMGTNYDEFLEVNINVAKLKRGIPG